MDTVYIKLTNGDELFAELVGEEDNKVLLSNVMIMETIQTEGEMKYLFMSRYSQYSEMHSMGIDRSIIIFMHDASDVIKTHYEISVRYAEQLSDQRFSDGIAAASRYLSAVLEKNRDTKDEEEEEPAVVSIKSNSSSTKH